MRILYHSLDRNQVLFKLFFRNFIPVVNIRHSFHLRPARPTGSAFPATLHTTAKSITRLRNKILLGLYDCAILSKIQTLARATVARITHHGITQACYPFQVVENSGVFMGA